MGKVPRVISLSIGGEAVKIRSKDREFIEQTKFRYAEFISSSVRSCAVIDVEIGVSEDFGLPFSQASDGPEVKFDCAKEEWTINWMGLYGRWNIHTKRGWMLSRPGPSGFNSFLRFVFSLNLAAKNGGLIHASSLIKKGQTYIFPGKSGAGKSTVARLSPDAILLSDDISLVKKGRSGFSAYGNPFWGELNVGGENEAAPIKGIYFLVKDTKNYLDILSPAQALRRLLPNVVFFARDRAFSRRLFNFCVDLTADIPAYNLHFVPDSSFWRCLDDG